MKNMLFQTFAKVGDGAFVTDEDQRIIFWNQAATQITGYPYSISPSTTRNHIRNILQKLHVHSRLEAVVQAYKHGLISEN